MLTVPSEMSHLRKNRLELLGVTVQESFVSTSLLQTGYLCKFSC